jgi:hypothetical protein
MEEWKRVDGGMDTNWRRWGFERGRKDEEEGCALKEYGIKYIYIEGV